MHIYLQGLTMGLAYVAPIGLQNLFVINSALTQKRSRVYITALIDGTMMLGAFRATLPAGGDLPFIFGFGSASILWFLTLSTVVSLLGSKFNEKILNIINKVCGAVIIFYGCKLLWSFVKLMGWL